MTTTIRKLTTIIKRYGTKVCNTVVVDEIKKIFSGEVVCYVYQNATQN
jgi:hypothetical protein